MLIVKLKFGPEGTKTDEIVELLADDPGFEKDVAQWCHTTGNTLLSIDKDIIIAFIKKQVDK